MPHAQLSPSTASRSEGPPPRWVLVLVDFINPLDFPGADRLAAGALPAARAAAALRRRVKSNGGVTVFANDNYGLWQSDFAGLWKRCVRMGGAPRALARLLRPAPDDITVLKPRHSAFFATPLDLLLQHLRCRRVIVAGLATDNCILFTAMEAYVRGYKLWIPSDCTAAESAVAKANALEHMRRVLKAETRPAL